MTDSAEQSDVSGVTVPQVDRRRHPRKPCFIPVTWVTSKSVFMNFIRNISAGGAFIETNAPCLPGEEVAIMFSFRDQEEPVTTTGEVMWRGPQGVGVKFTTASADFGRMVESHWSVRMNSL